MGCWKVLLQWKGKATIIGLALVWCGSAHIGSCGKVAKDWDIRIKGQIISNCRVPSHNDVGSINLNKTIFVGQFLLLGSRVHTEISRTALSIWESCSNFSTRLNPMSFHYLHIQWTGYVPYLGYNEWTNEYNN